MIDAKAYFEKPDITLYHGSNRIVQQPTYGMGNPRNDYGLGFYCTESVQLASEWACPTIADGYVNEYTLQTHGLRLLDLSSDSFTVLNWLAVLIQHRSPEINAASVLRARDFLIERFGVDLAGADIVYGYRADDSYFSFARAFLENRIGIHCLEQALFLGNLGYQVVLRSPEAFERLRFVSCSLAKGDRWNPLRATRDRTARDRYRIAEANSAANGTDDLFIIDLMRQNR